MSKLKSFPRSPRQGGAYVPAHGHAAPGHAEATQDESVTADELAYLRVMTDQERTTIAALQATRQSYNAHLARKYSLVQGDAITTTGQIQRAPKKDERAG